MEDYVKTFEDFKDNLTESNVGNYFYFLKGTSTRKFYQFLENLNLTDVQYKELAQFIEDFGKEKFSEGVSDERESNLYR
jgi:hypothetical protein